jgi:dipeptide/tripeptide permease
MVAHLVPKRMYGVTMGAWFFGCSLAALASGWFASLASIPDTLKDSHAILAIYSTAFTKISVGGLIITVLVFLVGPTIKRMGNLE